MLKYAVSFPVLAATAALSMVAAAQTAPPRTNQVMFNEAQAAFEKGDWKTAAVSFQALLERLKPGSRSIPSVRARLAVALERSGDAGAAEAQATDAIAAFTAQGIAKDGDLAAAYMLLGDRQRSRIEYDKAIASYQASIAAADGEDTRVAIEGARLALAYAAMTERPDLAASALDAELADTAFFSKLEKIGQAKILSNRAMAELNRGNAKEAQRYIDKALDIAGRDSTRVSLAQVGVRGNAALIYSKLGREDDVRQFLTFSGAGHLPSDEWLQNADLPLPVCGTDIDQKDFAVVEFAIGVDGRTIGAVPVYASRPGPVGTVFAQSVKDWRWRPAAAAKLNPFWRASIRMELRCVKRPPALALVDAFREATEQWLTQAGYPIDLTDPAAVVPDTATGRGAALARDFLALIRASSGKASTAAYGALEAELVAAQAPVAVRAFAAFETVEDHNDLVRMGGASGRVTRLAALTSRFAGVPGAERATAWFRTETALQLEAIGSLADARAQIQGVIDLPSQTLAADDPIRTLAMLHLSLIDKRTGKAAEADKRLAASGVDAEQCSLLDVRPVARNTTISGSIFPTEAMRWHFEGVVSEAFDIAADGSVQDVRTVLSYPPFIFGDATEKAVRQFRYLPPTLGDQPLGCTGERVNVRFVLPG